MTGSATCGVFYVVPALSRDPQPVALLFKRQTGRAVWVPARGPGRRWVWVLVLATWFCPSLPFRLLPQKQEGAGETGARCTRGLVCIDARRMRTRAHRFSGGSPAFPAQWLYDLFRALPGDRTFTALSYAMAADFSLCEKKRRFNSAAGFAGLNR
jgi:hypothetical protein